MAEESKRAVLWTLMNENRYAQGRNPLDQSIYDESFWMGIGNDNDDDVYYGMKKTIKEKCKES